MAEFSTYGAVFTVPDRYAAGHALTPNEAAALNGLLAEMISHKVRSLLSEKGFSKGSIVTEGSEVHAEAVALVAKEAAEYVFGAQRTGGTRVVRDPVSAKALELAKAIVRDSIKASPDYDKVGKSDGSDAGPRVYPWEKFLAKAEEIAQNEKVVAKAKKLVAEEQKPTAEVAVSL